MEPGDSADNGEHSDGDVPSGRAHPALADRPPADRRDTPVSADRPAAGWDGDLSHPVLTIDEVVERVRDLADRRGVRVALGALAVAAVGVWWFLAGAVPDAGSISTGPFTAGGTTIPFATSTTGGGPDGAGDLTAEGAGSGDEPEGGEMVVHAAGGVNVPGVYRLAGGARIGDLVAAAGGLAPDADGDRLNLAEPLRDGARVYVPRLGEIETPSPQGLDGPTGSSGPSGPSGSSADGGASSPVDHVDVNTATVDQLDELPGIGPSTAQAIVAHRDQHGPFGSVDELIEVRGIGPAKLEQLRPLVRV